MSNQKVALVTGASSGIGAATVKALVADGFSVIATARREDRLNELAKQDKKIETFVADLTSQSDVDALAQFCAGKNIGVLVNCAGGAFDASSVLDGDPEVWKKTYDINVIATLRVTQAITPLMIKNGQGHIVIISSTAGHRAYEMVAAMWQRSLLKPQWLTHFASNSMGSQYALQRLPLAWSRLMNLPLIVSTAI